MLPAYAFRSMLAWSESNLPKEIQVPIYLGATVALASFYVPLMINQVKEIISKENKLEEVAKA